MHSHKMYERFSEEQFFLSIRASFPKQMFTDVDYNHLLYLWLVLESIEVKGIEILLIPYTRDVKIHYSICDGLC